MKKTAVLTLAVFALVTVFAFAQEAEEPTIEERVTALEEADASGLTVTGALGLTLGATDQVNTFENPAFVGAESATATIDIASPDEKVTAAMSLNLLALPSVSSTYNAGGDRSVYDTWSVFGDGMVNTENEVSAYDTTGNQFVGSWATIEAIVDYISDLDGFDFDDDDDADDGEGDLDDIAVAAGYADFAAFVDAILADLNANTNLAETALDDGDIELKSPVAGSETAESDEFAVTTAVAGDVQTAAGAASAKVGAWVNAAVEVIMDLDDGATSGENLTGIDTAAQLADFINGLDSDQFDNLTDDEKDLITRAAEYVSAMEDIVPSSEYDPSVTTTFTPADFITAASITFNQVFGVVDITGNLTGQRVSVGAINLDTAGHQSDAVGSYPSIEVALSEGIVPGLSASGTFYSDANEAANSPDIDDVWYTWINEEDKDIDEPMAGFDLSLAYTMMVMEGVSVDANFMIAQYDFLTDDTDATETGIAGGVGFSGFGATASVDVATGLEMLDVNAHAAYDYMGIVAPAVALEYVSLQADDDDVNTDEFVLTYVKDDEWSAAQTAVQSEGGTFVNFTVPVTLDEMVGMPLGVSATVDYGMPTDEDAILGYGANVTVSPVEMVTVRGGVSNAGVYQGTIDSAEYLAYNASATVAPVENVSLNAGINSNPVNDVDGDFSQTNLTWNAGATLTHGTGKLSLGVGNAWDANEEENYNTWALSMSVSF